MVGSKSLYCACIARLRKNIVDDDRHAFAAWDAAIQRYRERSGSANALDNPGDCSPAEAPPYRSQEDFTGLVSPKPQHPCNPASDHCSPSVGPSSAAPRPRSPTFSSPVYGSPVEITRSASADPSSPPAGPSSPTSSPSTRVLAHAYQSECPYSPYYYSSSPASAPNSPASRGCSPGQPGFSPACSSHSPTPAAYCSTPPPYCPDECQADSPISTPASPTHSSPYRPAQCLVPYSPPRNPAQSGNDEQDLPRPPSPNSPSDPPSIWSRVRSPTAWAEEEDPEPARSASPPRPHSYGLPLGQAAEHEEEEQDLPSSPSPARGTQSASMPPLLEDPTPDDAAVEFGEEEDMGGSGGMCVSSTNAAANLHACNLQSECS